MGVIEATVRCNRGQLAVQGASTTKPSEAKHSHLAQEVSSGTGSQWDGLRMEVSHTSLRMSLLAEVHLGVPSKEINAGCANCVAPTGVKQATSLHLS